MADRSITVSLDFVANTNQAENALRNLQTSLQSISNMSTIGQDARMAKNIEEASAAAMKLRNNLQAAFDKKTGSLNLSKLNEEMAKSGMSAEKYRKTLSAIGPQGRQAFMELANAVVASETPLRQTTGLVDKLWDSLKRTAGWQLSSTMIHGFMGAVQSAYGYAQNLNQSLNNIRIVTGQSAEQMAQFAEQANKSAKALSSTTLDYTDAALIYYQQGIRDESEIAERTDATIKLANVSRQSAEEVSSQMTAIWNNFADGSHTLEYYADVITKLGATTASSSQEIAGGMEKFAAVAETVGLSYEYAASALATVVATTRQSEDTVGTGLRTIFSRLEGLKLGDTLEDGTDLNKYSEALKTVGVNIKDASGGLKDMDTILDETAAKWDTLDQAQKVAFATTVGGVRQYTNLIALLDNWDMMQENVTNALGSEGTLQEQQEIYAESWEAAGKRVRAAAEAIYSDLLKDDFFIDITKLFAGFLETIDQLIDAFGGLGGTLPLILTLMNKIFGEKMQAGAQRLVENLYYTTDKGKQERLAQDTKTKESFINETQKIAKSGVGSQEGKAAATGYGQIAAIQMEMIQNADKLTQKEKQAYDMEIQRLTALTKQTAELGKQADEAERVKNNDRLDIMVGANNKNSNQAYEKYNQQSLNWERIRPDRELTGESELSTAATLEAILNQEAGTITTTHQLVAAFESLDEVQKQFTGNMEKDMTIFDNLNSRIGNLKGLIIELDNSSKGLEDLGQDLQPGTQAFQEAQNVVGDLIAKAKELDVEIQIDPSAINSTKALKQAYSEIRQAIVNAANVAQGQSDKFGGIIERTYNANGLKEYSKEVQEAAQKNRFLEQSLAGLERAGTSAKTTLQQVKESLASTGGVAVTTSEKITMSLGALSSFGQAAMNLSMAFNSIKGLVNAITAPDMSGWERFTSILMSLGMFIPSFIAIINNLSTAMMALTEITSIMTVFKEVASGMDLATASAIRKTMVDTTLSKADKATAIASKLVATGMAEEEAAITATAIAEGAAEIPTLGLAGAFKVLGKAIWASLGPYLPIILAIVAAGYALVKLFQFIKANSPEAQLERQKQTTEDLANAYAHANEEAKELSDTLSKFKSNEDALKNLTKGSEEFSEKLKENNELMLKLIDAADLIAGEDFYIDSDGVYHLTKTGEGKVETAQNDLDQQAAQISAAQRMSQAVQAKKQNIVDIQEVAGAGVGVGGGAGQTFQEVDTAMRKQGQNSLEGFEAFNQLVKDIWDQNEEDIYTLEDLQDYIQRQEGTDKQVSAQAKKYVSDLANSSLNQQTKDLIASGGFIGEEDYFRDTHEANASVVNSSAKADSDVALAVAQFDKRVAASLNLAADGLTEGVSDVIEEPLKIAKDEVAKQTDKDVKEQYAQLMGKTIEELEDEDIDVDQMRDTLAMYLVAGMPEVADVILMTIKANLANSGFLDNAMQTAGINVREDQRGVFQEAALQVTDWSSEEQLLAFQETLSQLGMNIPLEQLKAFADALLQVGDAASTSNSLVEGQDKVDQAQENYDNTIAAGRNKLDGETQEEYAARVSAAAQELARAKDELDATLDSTLESEAGKYGLDGEYLKDLGDAYQELNEELAQGDGMLEASAEAAKDAAVRYARLNSAIEDIAKNYDDYVDVLNDAKKVEDGRAKAQLKNTDNFKKLQKSLAGLLDISEDLVDVDLIKAIDPKDFQKAADGDEEAISRIRDSFIDYQAQLAGLADDPNLDAFKEQLASLSEGQVIDIDNAPFLEALIQARMAAGDGAAEIETILSGMQINTDGLREFSVALDKTVYDAAVAAGNLVDVLGIEVAPDEQVIVSNDTKEVTGVEVTPQPISLPFSLPSYKANTEGGFDLGTPITGEGQITGYSSTPAKENETEQKQVTVTGLIAKNAHKSTGGIGPSTSTRKSSGGGGGGGGGGSKKSKDAPKADRGTRYHNVTRRQSNVSRQQTENNRRKDRAFGKAQVELAREDLEIQKKKIELQEEYTKEISKNLKEDREDMKKQFEALQLPINFKFDEDGEIENYQEIIDALFEKEKALVEQYNSGGLDDEAFEEAKKKLDEAKEALGNYEETLELQKDELQTLEEYMEELSDKALELTQIKFELEMSIIEDQLEWLDYSLSEIEDDAYSAAKAIALMGEQTSQYLKQGDIARAAISEILGRHGVNSIEELNGLSDSQIEALGFNKDEIEALKDYRSQLYESNQALLEMRRTITDKVLDTFDFFNEKVQKSYDQFDKYNDILESYNNIVDLLGTKTDAATRRLVKSIRDTQLKNLQNQSVSAKEIYEGALAHYDLAEKAYNDAVTKYGANSEEAQKMKEVLDQAGDARDEAYAEWLSALEASLEKAREIFEAEMEELQRDFEQALTGIYGTFDLFDAAYERAKELRDNYVPEYEKIYELNKLNRDIQKEIDNSSSLRDRKALRQLQEEINRKQEAGVQLSKYEVEEMRKKFELEQARMNLEDARNSKSEVRLTRDANGNWGYVYTASEDKVADAEQKYEDALYQYQKLSDDYINELDEKIKNLGKDYQEQIASIWEAWKNGEITEEQRDEQLAKLEEWYNGEKAYIISQFEVVTGNLQGSLGLMKELFGQEGNLIDTFGETLIGTLSGQGSIEEYFSTVDNGIIEYKNKVIEAADELKEKNSEIMEQNETTLDTIGKEVERVGDLSDKAKDKTKELVEEFTTNFGTVMSELETWDQKYGDIIKSAIGKNKEFIESLNTVIGKLAVIASYEMKDLYDYIDYLTEKAGKGEDITKEDWEGLDKVKNKYSEDLLKEAASLATGGYTGDWGDEGKIAILHEKEYVLNADLTARFFDALKTFSLVDQFVNAENQIQQQKLQIQTLETLSNYIDQLADRMNTTTINPNDFSTSLFNSDNQQLEQNVHIEASFPNVTQSNEIEMAFDNLVNKASQYANRKNMSSMTFGDAYISKF